MRKLLIASLVAALTSTVSVTATAASTYSQTKYPIVLAHGMFGFKSLLLAGCCMDSRKIII